MFGDTVLTALRITHSQRCEVCFQIEDVQLTTHSTVLHSIGGHTDCKNELHRRCDR